MRNKYLISFILFPMILISCINNGENGERVPSLVNSIDFNPIYGDRYKLKEYSSSRSYFTQENGFYNGRILNPINYRENEDAEPWYRYEEEMDPPQDFSDEEIIFDEYNAIIEDYLFNIEEGLLENEQTYDLIDILDTNDDIINKSVNLYSETILYNNFFHGDYYEFNNYHRTEQIETKRYENNIVSADIEGSILKPDSFIIDFTAIKQIWADENQIYELYEETFPPGFNLAKNDKITTQRGPGNFKKALSISGGGIAKRWFEKYLTMYQEYTDEQHEKYRPEYSYQITALKQEQSIQISFSGFNEQYQDQHDTTIYEMELNYVVTITLATIISIDAKQIYWAKRT